MSFSKPVFTQLLVAVFTLITSVAHATNGYFTHGTGARAKGQAGAGIASPVDPIAVTTNPAAAFAGNDRLDLGFSLFSPRRSYTASQSLANGNGGAFTIGEGRNDSGSEYFVIPHIAWTHSWSDSDALGIAFYGRGGMNTNWQTGTALLDPDGPGPGAVGEFGGVFGGGDAGVNLSQAFLDVAYARRVSPELRLGVAIVFGVQAFEAKGLDNFAGFTQRFALSGGSERPEGLTDNGHDFAFGVGGKVGFELAVSPSVSIAGAYQSRIRMSEFDDYADLFADAGDFDIPASAVLGISVQTSQRFRLSADIEHTRFSDVSAVGNSLQTLFQCPTAGAGGTDASTCLGGDNGAGFGWRDMTTIKVGAEWVVDDTWTVRAGVSDANQPIPESEVLFNILAPGVIERHVTLGVTRHNSSGGRWTLAIMHALDNTISGTNPFDPTQTISLQMDQWEAELAYSFRL